MIREEFENKPLWQQSREGITYYLHGFSYDEDNDYANVSFKMYGQVISGKFEIHYAYDKWSDYIKIGYKKILLNDFVKIKMR